MTDRLEKLERHLDEILAGPRRLIRSLSKHTQTTGTDMTAATETTYPVTSKNEYNEVGLTKRELFAAMAMQGIATGYQIGEFPEEVAAASVKMADALIAELNKETP